AVDAPEAAPDIQRRVRCRQGKDGSAEPGRPRGHSASPRVERGEAMARVPPDHAGVARCEEALARDGDATEITGEVAALPANVSPGPPVYGTHCGGLRLDRLLAEHHGAAPACDARGARRP